MATVIIWDARVERSAIVGVHPSDGPTLTADYPTHEIEWFDTQLSALLRLREQLHSEAAALMARTTAITHRLTAIDQTIARQDEAL